MDVILSAKIFVKRCLKSCSFFFLIEFTIAANFVCRVQIHINNLLFNSFQI
jgi:hypothetical protein